MSVGRAASAAARMPRWSRAGAGGGSAAGRRLTGFWTDVGRAIGGLSRPPLSFCSEKAPSDSTRSTLPNPHALNFCVSGGRTGLTVTLTYDPPVRVTRLDYLASCLGFPVFTVQASRRSDRHPSVQRRTRGSGEDASVVPSELASALELGPADRARPGGPTSWGGTRGTSSAGPREFVLAVRNVNCWHLIGLERCYAVAVLLERHPGHPACTPSWAQLEPLVEMHVRCRSRARSR